MVNNVCLLCFCIIVATCAPVINKDGKVFCKEVPDLVLEEVLGAAYNPRYMSVDVPAIEMNGYGKRKTAFHLDFYVDNEFYQGLEEPAWTVKNHIESAMKYSGNTVQIMQGNRYKRDMDYLQEWHCKSGIKWTDLGPDYFPRYLRSVECLAENCWFNIYKCRSKSFTVKILKRKRDRCVVAEPGTTIGISGLPRDLKELWVWEERAVSFCCDCSM